MGYNPEKISQQGARTSSISTVIGISLVLFMLGTLGLILLNAQKLSDYVKENMRLHVFFHQDVPDSTALQVQGALNQKNYTRMTEFITREQAAREMEKELGEDFISILDYNPLSSSVNLYLKATYSDSASVGRIVAELRDLPEVKEVDYRPDMMNQVNTNIRKISLVMLAFSSLLLVISIALINNTIRLAIYSKRFLIKTMQLVGATPGFIRRPFLWQGTLQGLYAAVIALLLIAGLLYLLYREVPDLVRFQDFRIYAQLFGGVVVLGVIIAWISTYLAVRKYIRLKSEDVY